MIQKPSYLHLLRLLITIFLKINCTELEIENIIEVLNSNKASGDDGISHKMLKGVSKTVSKPLCILMNSWGNISWYTDWQKKHYILPDVVSLMKSYKHAIFVSKIWSLESRPYLALLFLQFVHDVWRYGVIC